MPSAVSYGSVYQHPSRSPALVGALCRGQLSLAVDTERGIGALAEQGLPSLMPSQLFDDPDYVWDDPEMDDKD